nr:hypothetical protein [Tanacetum cinerariifolium]
MLCPPDAAEAVQIILTGIDNDIYSTVDASPNAYEMWNAIERLKQEPSMVDDDEDMSKDKEIDKLMALISLSNAMYESQRSGTVAGASDTKPKRAKDATYHREKMLLCKQEEARTQLNAELADWKDDTDDESNDQELEAHYMYMAKLQQVSPGVVDSGPIFDKEPEQKIDQNDEDVDLAKEHVVDSGPIFDTESEQKVQNDDHYDVFAIELDMNYDSKQIDQNDEDVDLAKERELHLAKEQLKDKLSAHQDTISILKQQKDSLIKLYKTREDKEIEKVIDLENKVKVLDNIVYKTGQSVQTMNMLNNKCRTSFSKLEYLKKAKQANPRLYDIAVLAVLKPEHLKVDKARNE